ncbi:MAG: ATP-binding protein, partial [Catenulispora sp.]|nr:ATP-binding protein [Catenulispora sp.]
MAKAFVGRRTELDLLRKRFDRVSASSAAVAVTIKGRRQVGKSRLVQEFCDRSGAPYLFFAATKGASPVEAMTAFHEALRDSPVTTRPELVPDGVSGGWPDAFRVLARVLPDTPSIVVLDELPWLAEQDPIFDGALQTAWDRLLAGRPVLLLLLGSDLPMRDRLTAYDQPFFGRADAMTLGPLRAAETGEALGLSGGDAIDAQLISGGLPGILRSWPDSLPPMAFLEAECADPAAALFSVPES